MHILHPGESTNHNYTIYNEKYFSDDHFYYIVRVLTWRALKMRSATSSEGPRLVRIAVLCAQTRMAIEMRYAFSNHGLNSKHCTWRSHARPHCDLIGHVHIPDMSTMRV